MLNRGVNGDEAADMLARLDTAVIAEKPDLVLWQVGTNSVLRDKAVLPHATLLHEGLARLKAIGADIVLIDPQYAPKVIAKPNAEGMVSLIATAAKAEHVCLFHRFALMRQWHEVDRLPFETFLSADGLHMNDWSYACIAKWLGGGDRRGGHPADRDRGRRPRPNSRFRARRRARARNPAIADTVRSAVRRPGMTARPVRFIGTCASRLRRLQRIQQILHDVVGMLEPGGEPHEARR